MKEKEFDEYDLTDVPEEDLIKIKNLIRKLYPRETDRL